MREAGAVVSALIAKGIMVEVARIMKPELVVNGKVAGLSLRSARRFVVEQMGMSWRYVS